jgi:predicted nucleotidyltransferase
MELPKILAERETYSRIRLNEFKQRVSKVAAGKDVEGLAVFCAGSYARHEASEHSDIDLFFVYDDVSDGQNIGWKSRKTNEIKLFADIINVAEAMDFPAFSNDSQYLHTLRCSDILKHLGSPTDDFDNFFTMRMLMLLESQCVFGEEAFVAIQRNIVAAYYRDYPDHQASFEPWFLMNDIGRFWKTLLLNYEHKRNQPTDDFSIKTKQKVKNFKLKFSRMTTCFATISALGSYDSPVNEEQIVELAQKTPRERLQVVVENIPETENAVTKVLTAYAWFIEQTGQSTDDLNSGFEDKASRADRFDRANSYGDAMYELLTVIGVSQDVDQQNRLLRYLVI